MRFIRDLNSKCWELVCQNRWLSTYFFSQLKESNAYTCSIVFMHKKICIWVRVDNSTLHYLQNGWLGLLNIEQKWSWLRIFHSVIVSAVSSSAASSIYLKKQSNPYLVHIQNHPHDSIKDFWVYNQTFCYNFNERRVKQLKRITSQ